jgi:hypothetical protein
MNRSNPLLQLLLPTFVLLSITCNKHIPQATADKLDLIASARSYIDSESTAGIPANYRASQPKTIRWDLAQVVQVGKSEGILTPIVYDNPLLVRANFAGSQLFHMVIRRPESRQWHPREKDEIHPPDPRRNLHLPHRRQPYYTHYLKRQVAQNILAIRNPPCRLPISEMMIPGRLRRRRHEKRHPHRYQRQPKQQP